jgi:large subunit ribosomal protein L22
MEASAKLSYARIGSQKARLVADLIRGKGINEAVRILSYTENKPSDLIVKLLKSAISNAEQKGANSDKLFVKTIFVDQGPSIKRFRPRAQGRAFGIRKKLSHINIVLGER